MEPADPDARGVDLLAAVRDHPFAFLLPILILATALGVLGYFEREHRFTAEARISVGQLDVATQGLPGFTQAGSAIAAAYARAIDAPDVAGSAARAAKVRPADAVSALDAAPIPDAPLIRVEAERGDAQGAIALANAGARALVRFSRRTSGTDVEGSLQEYTRLAREAERLRLARISAQTRFARKQTRKRRVALQNVEGKYRKTVLERDALANVYGTRANGNDASGLLRVLAPATAAESDRESITIRYALTGAAAGLLFGLALAAGRASRRRHKRQQTAAA